MFCFQLQDVVVTMVTTEDRIVKRCFVCSINLSPGEANVILGSHMQY